mgnify:FL=1
MKLGKEFLGKYKDFPDHMTELSKFVYYRTYSRWLPKENRRETWKETCARAVEYNTSLAATSKEEAEELFDNMYNLKQFISGRSLWIGGSEASKKVPLAGFNCSFVVIDNLVSFDELFYLLMVGTGVGFRILPSDVAKLPTFRQNVELNTTKHKGMPWGDPVTEYIEASKDHAYIIVGDSKEGWKEALATYLRFMTNPKKTQTKLIIDFTKIRPKGTPLMTFGGTASGSESIEDMFNKIHKVITEGEYSSRPIDGKLRPIHCLDICNLIGQNVVVGGVRRTAEIALIDPKDTECTEAKSNLTPEKYHRFMSNNSLYIEETPTKEYLQKIFDSIRATGEPGFVNVAESKRRRGDYAGTNPCVTGDTEILTKEFGYIPIKDVVDTNVTVWNGYEWSQVRPRVTGYNQMMSEVKFSNGTSLKCTNYHQFVLAGGERVMATELKINDKLEKWSLPAFEAEAKEKGIFHHFSDIVPYVAGFYSGDGVTAKPIIWLYDEKRKLKQVFIDKGCKVTEGVERDTVHLPSHFPKHRVPNANDSIVSRLYYLAGLLDSDGCINSKDGSVAISSIDKNFLKELFKMLATLGVNSSISEMKEEGERELPANDGTGDKKNYFCNKCYRLTISAWNVKKLLELGLKTYRLKLEPNPNRDASRFVYITDVVRIENEPTVYCFTEPKNHTGIFNGVMTAQCGEILLPANAVCNLTTINLTQFVVRGKYKGQIAVDMSNLKKALRLSARAGYRMTCVDLELPGWNEIHHRDRLLGCSITGYQDLIGMLPEGFNEALFLEEMKKWTRFYADEYAEELGTPKPKLVTSVKPEGTLSLIAGGVSPGVHYQHSPYFIRRIRVNASDPLAKTALELGWQIHPEVGQTMENATTLVIDFPCKTEARKTKNDVSAVDQLKTYLMFQKNYVEHNASNTISVKPDEWEEVVDFVHTNWNDVLGVTFLESNSTYYPLLPYEECTKETYDDLVKKTRQFDPEILNNMEITTRNMGKEYEILDDKEGCENGVCPIR